MAEDLGQIMISFAFGVMIGGAIGLLVGVWLSAQRRNEP